MTERSPNRFRRRLTGAFVLVAAASAGAVAVLTFVLASEYRWRNFRSASLRDARTAMAFAPRDLNVESFNRLRLAYEGRSDADMVALQEGRVFSSSPGLRLSHVPASLRRVEASHDPTLAEAQVNGRSSLVVGTRGPAGAIYYFFFSLEQLQESLDELRRVAAAGWVVTVGMAGAIGHIVARRTLRPVAAAAEAAQAIAGGDLGARLPAPSRDEFGALAASFNHMADTLQDLIVQLHESALRERRFTADVAHELRTPVTGMSASASVLGEQLDDLPIPLRRPAAVLVTDVHRLRDLVLELLELSRLDRGTEPVAPEPLRVAGAVSAVVESAELRRCANIEIDVDDDAMVIAEPQRLRRILANLIDNAIVHGGGKVVVTGRVTGPDVFIRVADDGPGVAAGDETRIFDRFFKSDLSRAGGGSGLGLSIARKHALAQNGDLFLERPSEGGACFTLRLPASAALCCDDPVTSFQHGCETAREQ